MRLQPASSTYADCEETDSPTTEQSPLKLPIDLTAPVTNETAKENDATEMPVSEENAVDVKDTDQTNEIELELDVHQSEKELLSEEKPDLKEEIDDSQNEPPSPEVSEDRVDDIHSSSVVSKVDECDLDESKIDHEVSGDSDHSGYETDNGENYRENGDGEEVDEVK